MGDFSGARPQGSTRRDYPRVDVPKKGVYQMILASFGTPEEVTDKCVNCKGKGTVEGATCRKCQGTKWATRRVIRLNYETIGFPTFAQEDMTYRISDKWTTKGDDPRTISASRLFLRLRDFTGLLDPDMLAGIMENDVERESLVGTEVEVMVAPGGSTGQYLKIVSVERIGPVQLRSAANRSSFEGPPSKGLTHVSSVGNGLPEGARFAPGGPPAHEIPPEAPEEVPEELESVAPTPSISDLRAAFEATGRVNPDEFVGWFGVQTGYAKSVSADTKRALAKMIATLPAVTPKLSQQMRNAALEPELDINEEVPF